MLRCRWLLVMEPTTCDQEELWSVYRLEIIPLDAPGEPIPVVVHTVDELIDALFVQWNGRVELFLSRSQDVPCDEVKG